MVYFYEFIFMAIQNVRKSIFEPGQFFIQAC